MLLSDGMSMACGLELRVPFLVHQLVEIVLCLPSVFSALEKDS